MPISSQKVRNRQLRQCEHEHISQKGKTNYTVRIGTTYEESGGIHPKVTVIKNREENNKNWVAVLRVGGVY
jgi:hypothetical protein